MAQDAIRGRMNELWTKAREELLGVMEKAQAGDIISGTEWEVRRVHQQLARDCFQLLVQRQVEGLDQTPAGVFSPLGEPPRRPGPARLAECGPARASGRHGQR